jgi:hypothetical protein
MDWGDPAALSPMVTVALRLPVAVGLNVTEILQCAPAATDVPQVFVWAKSRGSAPPMAMLVIVSGAVPVLVRVTDWDELLTPMFWRAKLTVEGLSDTDGTPTPVPFKVTDCGDPAALSAMARAAPRLPAAIGLNVTEMPQCAPAATDVPQVFVSAKSCVSEPPMAMLLIVSAPVPVLVRVTDCAALAVPAFWLAKVSAEALSDTTGVPAAAEVKVTVASVFQ